MLLKRQKYYPFLKRIITSNKKRVVYKNVKRKKLWNTKYEPTQTTSGIAFYHDNARILTSLVTCQKLLHLKWDVLKHPPYFQDLVPSDYYLFWYLQKFWTGRPSLQIRTSNELVRWKQRTSFFSSKDQKFYKREINLLPERWRYWTKMENI